MRLLLDTHILLWAAGSPEKLPQKTRDLLQDDENALFFSDLIDRFSKQPYFDVRMMPYIEINLGGRNENGYHKRR
jgi:hypothetical protein